MKNTNVTPLKKEVSMISQGISEDIEYDFEKPKLGKFSTSKLVDETLYDKNFCSNSPKKLMSNTKLTLIRQTSPSPTTTLILD